MAAVPRVRAGLRGATGSSVELRVDGGYLQFRPASGGVWTNIVPTSELKGPQGPPGPSIRMLGEVATVGALPASGNEVNDAYTVTADGDCYVWDGTAWNNVGPFQGPAGDPGGPGPSVELQRTATHVQWRVAGTSDPWTNIIALSILKGDPGPDGILYGAGAPSSGIGSDGGTYLDKTDAVIYDKAAGAWTALHQLATIDPDTGDLDESLVPSELLTRLQAVELAVEDGAGTGGVGGLIDPTWAFGKGSAGDQTLVVDTAGEWYPLKYPSVLTAVELQMDAAGNVDTLVTVEHRASGSSTVTNLYTGAVPATIPTGETLVAATLPPTTSLAAGHIRPRLQAVPDGPSGSGGTVTKVDEEPYTSGSSTLPTHPLVLPAGGAAGDMVAALVSLQSPVPNPDAAWALRKSQVSDATTVRSRLALHTAPWASDLDMDFDLTPSGTASNSPMSALTVLLRNVDLSNPVVDSESNTTGNLTGAGTGDLATPTKAAAADDSDLTLYFASWWMGNGITGHTVDNTAALLADDGITTLVNEVTTRVSATNVGLWVGVGAGFAAAAAIPSVDISLGGGTGGLGAVTMNSGFTTFKGAASATGPVRLLAILNLLAQQATA